MHNVQWGLYNVQGGLQGEQHDAVQHNHHSEISQSAPQYQLAKHKLGTTWVGNLGEVIHKECYRGLFKLFTFSLLSTHQTYVSNFAYIGHISKTILSQAMAWLNNRKRGSSCSLLVPMPQQQCHGDQGWNWKQLLARGKSQPTQEARGHHTSHPAAAIQYFPLLV